MIVLSPPEAGDKYVQPFADGVAALTGAGVELQAMFQLQGGLSSNRTSCMCHFLA